MDNGINKKAVIIMEVLSDMNNGEIIQRGIEDFREVQRYMTLTKTENAIKTYAELKENIFL